MEALTRLNIHDEEELPQDIIRDVSDVSGVQTTEG